MPSVLNQSYELVPVTDLRQHPRNANTGDIGAIHTSIKSSGFYGAIVAQVSTGFVLAGNHRLAAAQHAGLEAVPVTWVDVDDEEALRILLVDNRTAELATSDDQAIATILQELAATPEGLVGTGYDGDDLDTLLFDIANTTGHASGEVVDPEPTAADEAQAKWLVQVGDTWSCGGITLTCGDARDTASYTRMPGGADVLWTDPPYGVNHSGGNTDPRASDYRKGGKITNDALKPPELRELLQSSFDVSWSRIQPGAAWYVAAPAGPLHLVFCELLAPKGWRQTIIWQKHRGAFNRSDYHYQHEPILYGWKPGAAHTWVGDRKQTSLLAHDRPHASKEHPTMKPVSLVRQCLANHATPGTLVLDPFVGSGTTLLAAQQLGLCAHGIELDPKYAAVTLQRLADAGVTMIRDVI